MNFMQLDDDVPGVRMCVMSHALFMHIEHAPVNMLCSMHVQAVYSEHMIADLCVHA